MSKHEVKVIKIQEIETHPNADALDIIKVWGYQCIVKKNQFKVNDLAAYIEPDYMVNVGRPEFSFLDKGKANPYQRVKSIKLRGLYSQGLLIPAPEGTNEGDDVMELLGIQRYNPEEHTLGNGLGKGASYSEVGPNLPNPVYDLENYKKYHHLINEDDDVIVTTKIHGTNARFVFHDGRMWCGSRTQWKRPPGPFISQQGNEVIAPKCVWWSALEQNPWIEEWCRKWNDVILYGEVYGPNVQGGFHYGKAHTNYGFAVFDMFVEGNWLPNQHMYFFHSELQFAPVLYTGKFNREKILALSEETETFNDCGHVREGVVIKLVNERFDPTIGRVVLKNVSHKYLMM